MGKAAAMKRRAGGFQQQDSGSSEHHKLLVKGMQNDFAKIGRDRSLDGPSKAAAFKALAKGKTASSFLSSETNPESTTKYGTA